MTRQSLGRIARSRHAFVAALAFICVVLAISRLQDATAVPAAAQAFDATWARTDKPVADGVANRTWFWGPGPIAADVVEPYAESPGGMREVRYYDKARMEVTDPNADPTTQWYVTNGLLVWELINGEVQTGDATYEQRQPAEINVAGDLDDPNAPTYATMKSLLYVPSLSDGQVARSADRPRRQHHRRPVDAGLRCDRCLPRPVAGTRPPDRLTILGIHER